ncbi:hypothetical protein V8E54_005219 [Elaphomyces granulatus]
MAYVQESVDIRETVDRDYYAPQYEGRLPPRPWAPRWDDRSERWLYFNERTGETNWNFPESEEFTEFVETDDYYEENKAQDKLRYGGAGAVAGAAAMYEGDRAYNKFEEKKYGVERDVENLPEEAAEWAGEKVGRAEYDVDRVEEDVGDLPDEAARWTGRKVGDVERFGDDIKNNFEEGKEEGYDDQW